MMEALATDKESAHRAASYAYREAQEIIARGKRAVICAKEQEDERTLQQLRWYWGVLLREISEQATIDGVKYAPEAWHGLAKRLHLGFEIKREKVAGRKKATISRRLKSVGKLSQRAMTVYLEKVTAWAVADFGVVFPEGMP